jgi:hypothetical protein
MQVNSVNECFRAMFENVSFDHLSVSSMFQLPDLRVKRVCMLLVNACSNIFYLKLRSYKCLVKCCCAGNIHGAWQETNQQPIFRFIGWQLTCIICRSVNVLSACVGNLFSCKVNYKNYSVVDVCVAEYVAQRSSRARDQHVAVWHPTGVEDMVT